MYYFDLSVVIQCPPHLAFPRKFEGWFVLNNTGCEAKQFCEPIIFYVTILMVKDFSAVRARREKESHNSAPLTFNAMQMTSGIAVGKAHLRMQSARCLASASKSSKVV